MKKRSATNLLLGAFVHMSKIFNNRHGVTAVRIMMNLQSLKTRQAFFYNWIQNMRIKKSRLVLAN